MAESKDWKSWMPEPKGWKNWMPEQKGWKMSQKNSLNQGVVKAGLGCYWAHRFRNSP
jgi:hypothetical protein